MFYNLALLLPCTICLFWAVLLFCRRNTNSRSQNVMVLCAFLGSFSLYVIAVTLGGITDYSAFYRLDVLDSFITLMVFPLIYLYFKSLTNESGFTKMDYIWFLPSLILGCGTLFFYEMIGQESMEAYIRSSLYSDSLACDYESGFPLLDAIVKYQPYNVIFLVQGVCVGVYALRNLLRYHRRLRDFYSVIDDKSISLNYAVLVCYALSVLLPIFFLAVGGCLFWIHHPVLTELFFICWGGVLYCTYYFGSQIKYTVENLARDLESADREALENNYIVPEENEDIAEVPDVPSRTSRYPQLLASFNKLIDEDKIFLQSDLRMDELVRLMHTNRTYISRMINEEFGCAFSDYINRKRIGYAKLLMSSNPEMKQQELAEKSGFLSASSFSKTFRQQTGMPPGEWMKSRVSEP